MDILPFKLISPDLDVQHLLQLCKTNSRIAKICSDPQTWRSLLFRDYHIDINKPFTLYLDLVLLDIRNKLQELLLLNRELFAFIYQTQNESDYYKFTDYDGIDLQTVTNEFNRLYQLYHSEKTFMGIKISQHLFSEIKSIYNYYQNEQIEIFGVLMNFNYFSFTKCDLHLLNVAPNDSLSSLLYYRSYLDLKLCLSLETLRQIEFEHSKEPF